MPTRAVHTMRKLTPDADRVWSYLSDFDLGWHPGVARCALRRGPDGAVLREFSDADGQSYLEQRTYFSNSDRVLNYRLLSGIEGAQSYAARVEVTPGDGAVITWRAEISASAERLDGISKGTEAIFEAGFDVLNQMKRSKRQNRPATDPQPGAAIRKTVEGTPRLSYLTTEDGDGPVPVVFLHGIGGQATNWTAQVAHLGVEFRCAALDLRGYGQSSLGFQQTQIEDYCDDILHLLDALGAERMVLVGLSLGSWIATSFAMRHPEKLAGLVLAGGCTGMSEADMRERENFRVSREIPLNEGQSPADFASAVVNVIAGAEASEAQRAALHASMAAIPTETYRDALRCFCNPVEQFDFAKVPCPVLLTTGEHDVLAPPAEIRRVSERIHDARFNHAGDADVQFEILAGAGHVCNLERPEAFNTLLGQFLRRLPGVSGHDRPSKSEKQAAKRARILKAAHEEFCSLGFDGASMDRLAEQAGVSKPTLYQYFGDKEGLFSAVLEAGRAHLIAPLVDQNGALVEKLWRFSWTYADFVLRPDMLSLARLILGEAARRPDSAIAYHQSGPSRAFEGIVAFVQDCVAAGELSVDDPSLAAQDLWSLILSGPRDHHLHYVNDAPNADALLASISHGLKVFLTVYSTNAEADLSALDDKVAEAAAAPANVALSEDGT